MNTTFIQSMAANNQDVNIPALTGLRAFASIWVFIFHLYKKILIDTPFYTFASFGSLGVGIFFILSGFILAHVYQEKMSLGKTNFFEFMIYRFCRIYPLHILCLIFIACFGWFFVQNSNTISFFIGNVLLATRHF